MATPCGAASLAASKPGACAHATYTVPWLSTATGSKFHWFSNADPLLPELGITIGPVHRSAVQPCGVHVGSEYETAVPCW